MEPQDLTFSQGLGPIRDDTERAKLILGRGENSLTESDLIFVDVYLRNFDHVKSRLEAFLQSYIDSDNPQIVAELLALSDRMDLTLKRFLELEDRKAQHIGVAASATSEPDLAASAADYALQEEMRQVESDGGSSTPYLEETEWGDFVPFDCPICFDRVEAPMQGSRVRGCGHFTCRACAVDVVTTAVNSAKVLDLTCPSPGCDREFSYNQIRSLLDGPAFARYEEFSLLAALAADPNVRWCPKKDCGNAVILEDQNQKKIVCGRCTEAFCAECNDEWHLGTCQDFEQWKIDNGKVNAKRKKKKMCLKNKKKG
jgi:hypothetical protein